MSLVKGIKKGKTIELLEEINIPDVQEILFGRWSNCCDRLL